MIFIVDYVKEKPEGPTAKKRRTGMEETSNSQTNVNVSENEEMAMVQYVSQPPEAKESEELNMAVSDGTVPSSCPHSADTNGTEGNYLLFKMHVYNLKILNANIYRSISGYDHF